jgi:hypothetical protein
MDPASTIAATPATSRQLAEPPRPAAARGAGGSEIPR